jgi:hypothetical protein
MYKNIEDKSEIFITPIPRKITHFGFRLIMLLTVIIAFMAATIKPVKHLTYPLTINAHERYIEMNIDDFGKIKNITKATLRLPFSDTTVQLYLDTKNTEIWRSKLHIPVVMDSTTLSDLKIRESLNYFAEINFYDQSLLQKAMNSFHITNK